MASEEGLVHTNANGDLHKSPKSPKSAVIDITTNPDNNTAEGSVLMVSQCTENGAVGTDTDVMVGNHGNQTIQRNQHSPKSNHANQQVTTASIGDGGLGDKDNVWHTSSGELSTVVQGSIPEIIIGFDGFKVDPESKHKAWLMTMDYVQRFDIELDKDYYYAGEIINGRVIIYTTENIKVKGIRLSLRGKAHTEWKISKAGDTRTVKDDEYYIDDKKMLWGKDKLEKQMDGSTPILPRGRHTYQFDFKLPETALPCSFESKVGHVRYYLRVVMDIPYASPPQSIKYFTIVGPHIDCMDEKYLAPKFIEDKHRTCCFCCMRGLVRLQATLERSAYCCGEHIRVRTEIQNQNDQPVSLICKFVQYVEYYMNKSVLGILKTVSNTVWEYQTEPVRPHHTARQERLQEELQVPVIPPTLQDMSGLIQIYYVLKLYVNNESAGELIHIQFPITIGTVPFRIPNMPPPQMMYDTAVNYVEGGKYISSEFQLGQVYMGEEAGSTTDEEILYRPIYSCVPHEPRAVTNTKKHKCSDRTDIDQKEESVNEQVNFVHSRQKSVERKKLLLKTKSSERLKTSEVVTVDEVSSSEPWEVVALKK